MTDHLNKEIKNIILNRKPIKPIFCIYVSHKRHEQFEGTKSLILTLNSVSLVKLLCSPGKIIHNFCPKASLLFRFEILGL